MARCRGGGNPGPRRQTDCTQTACAWPKISARDRNRPRSYPFLAKPAPGFAEQATPVAAGPAAGEDLQKAAQAAWPLHAYEIAFEDALAGRPWLIVSYPQR